MKPFCISGKTRIYGIIGDPIEHTISPAMQNSAFQSAALDYVYLPFHVTAEKLTDAVSSIKALGLCGLNVTIPHKINVMPMLDEIDPLAAGIGAVNTIVIQNGNLIGYNTDAEGILRSLQTHDISIKDKNTVILGAGGAARAAAFILAREGACLTIINRTLSSAEKCAASLSTHLNKQAAALELNDRNLKVALEKADIFINATSLGMYPCTDETPVPAYYHRPGMTVLDIVYNPLITKLLHDATKAGAVTISGVEMLVWQGASAFEKWTGLQAPVELMRRKAVYELKKFTR